MIILITGVLLWSLLHWVPAIAPGPRQQLIDKLGKKRYRGLFSLSIVAAMVTIIIGFNSAELVAVYVPPLYGNHVIVLLMFIAFLLFAAAEAGGNIKRFIRHPMLLAVIVWASAHLLANGDSRSIALFGGLGLWALIEIILINRRDGAWQRPAPAPISKDVKTVVGAIVVFVIVIFVHTAIGVSPLPGIGAG